MVIPKHKARVKRHETKPLGSLLLPIETEDADQGKLIGKKDYNLQLVPVELCDSQLLPTYLDEEEDSSEKQLNA